MKVTYFDKSRVSRYQIGGFVVWRHENGIALDIEDKRDIEGKKDKWLCKFFYDKPLSMKTIFVVETL